MTRRTEDKRTAASVLQGDTGRQRRESGDAGQSGHEERVCETNADRRRWQWVKAEAAVRTREPRQGTLVVEQLNRHRYLPSFIAQDCSTGRPRSSSLPRARALTPAHVASPADLVPPPSPAQQVSPIDSSRETSRRFTVPVTGYVCPIITHVQY